jgi:sugar lactone lactonase YvrE
VLGACAGSDKAGDSSTAADIPLGSSYILEGDDLFPEGLAWSDSERAFFTGSLTQGTIVRVDPDGTQTEVFRPDSGTWMSLGMKVDESRGELLVCSVRDYGSDSAQSVFQRFSVADGSLMEQLELTPGAVCNDVAFAEDGTAWLTEREGPRLWQGPAGGGSVDVLVEDPLLEPDFIGCNGIVLPDQNTLLVGKYAAATLLRISRDNPTDIHEVTLSGDSLGTLPDGADGMFLDGNTLLIAGNSQWLTVESTDGWTTATATAHTPASAIAAITVAEGRRFGLKVEVVPFVVGLEVSLPFEILEL